MAAEMYQNLKNQLGLAPLVPLNPICSSCSLFCQITPFINSPHCLVLIYEYCLLYEDGANIFFLFFGGGRTYLKERHYCAKYRRSISLSRQKEQRMQSGKILFSEF